MPNRAKSSSVVFETPERLCRVLVYEDGWRAIQMIWFEEDGTAMRDIRSIRLSPDEWKELMRYA